MRSRFERDKTFFFDSFQADEPGQLVFNLVQRLCGFADLIHCLLIGRGRDFGGIGGALPFLIDQPVKLQSDPFGHVGALALLIAIYLSGRTSDRLEVPDDRIAPIEDAVVARDLPAQDIGERHLIQQQSGIGARRRSL